ncbi:hypothetical protein [Actinoplanes regularis]|nr:hypothetical protein [Actinoplanes regularis]
MHATLRAWVTGDHQHDGLRVAGDRILERLRTMVAALRLSPDLMR